MPKWEPQSRASLVRPIQYCEVHLMNNLPAIQVSGSRQVEAGAEEQTALHFQCLFIQPVM